MLCDILTDMYSRLKSSSRYSSDKSDSRYVYSNWCISVTCLLSTNLNITGICFNSLIIYSLGSAIGFLHSLRWRSNGCPRFGNRSHVQRCVNHDTALNTRKHIQVVVYRIFLIAETQIFVCHLACSHNARPLFYATTINSPCVPFGVPTSMCPLCHVFPFNSITLVRCRLHEIKLY